MDTRRFDALIIGFGKGGKTLAAFLANQGMKVAVAEQSAGMYGGTCINVGCIPTKALSYSASISAKQSNRSFEEKRLTYQKALEDKDRLIADLRKKNYDNLNNHSNITVITGRASFISSREVKVESDSMDDMIITADKIFINTGATPVVPKIEGVSESKRVYTSTSMLQVAELPRRLVIIGSGYIGLEFASMFADFGSAVTVLEVSDRFLPREDQDVAGEIRKVLENKGIRFVFNTSIRRIQDDESVSRLFISSPDYAEDEMEADAILVAAGRKPNTDRLNVEAAGVALTDRNFIRVDDLLQTNVPNIWAIGDVNGGPQFTYVSLDDFRIIRDQLFGEKKRSVQDRKWIPTSVFIDPPLSNVGMSEEEAIRLGYEVKVAKMPAAAIMRAKQTGRTEGFLKAVVDAKTNWLLGCTLFCAESSEMINIVHVFMQTGQDYRVLRDTMFTHPTMSEALNELLSLIK